MTGPDINGHPHDETLEAYATGSLDAVERPGVAEHLKACARCRREVQDLTRFLALDSDDELAAEADWDRAEVELERGWDERPSTPQSTAWWRRRSTHRWWPVAAAAAVLLMVVNVSTVHEDPPRGAVRGGEGEVIALISPVGEVADCPEQFTWSFEGEHDSYILEVFTVDLDLVASFGDLQEAVWVMGDGLCDSLSYGQRYLWSVQAETGGEVVARSAAQWFTVLGGHPEN